MFFPHDLKKFADKALDVIEQCRESAPMRAAQARALRQWTYTGSPDGQAAIVNRLNPHLERTSSLLYSPTQLRFFVDFTHLYPKPILEQAEVVARVLTRDFERRDIDVQVGSGVFIALQHGAAIPKLIQTATGWSVRILMPWQMGVYREDKNDWSDQEACVETSYITPWELWRRISHLPDAPKLWKRATAYAKRQSSNDDDVSYFHQVLLSGTSPIVQTQAPFITQPGGLVAVNADPGGAILSPDVAESLIAFHEMYFADDERGGDYTTVQIAEPDVLIAPRFRRRNFFVPDYLPYGMIQPNRVEGYFWGRSEISDLIKLQHFLRDRMEDIKKLMSLQYDRLFAFIGGQGMTDELYEQFRHAGFVALDSGGDVKDITPPLPEKAFEELKTIIELMDEVSGFSNILSGQGEPGVRAGNHAQTLLRTASPRMRDRALLIERQIADIADKLYQGKAAKEAVVYHTEGGQEFMLGQLPEDYHISVDSHSSSPIYEMDHRQDAMLLARLGAIGGEDIIDLFPLPHRDLLKQHLRERQAQQAAFMQQHPELLQKQLHRSHAGR